MGPPLSLSDASRRETAPARDGRPRCAQAAALPVAPNATEPVEIRVSGCVEISFFASASASLMPVACRTCGKQDRAVVTVDGPDVTYTCEDATLAPTPGSLPYAYVTPSPTSRT